MRISFFILFLNIFMCPQCVHTYHPIVKIRPLCFNFPINLKEKIQRLKFKPKGDIFF